MKTNTGNYNGVVEKKFDPNFIPPVSPDTFGGVTQKRPPKTKRKPPQKPAHPEA